MEKFNPIEDQPKWWRARKEKQAKEKGRGRPTHRFEPSVFRVLSTFVEFHYRTLEPKQLEPKGLRIQHYKKNPALQKEYSVLQSTTPHYKMLF